MCLKPSALPPAPAPARCISAKKQKTRQNRLWAPAEQVLRLLLCGAVASQDNRPLLVRGSRSLCSSSAGVAGTKIIRAESDSASSPIQSAQRGGRNPCCRGWWCKSHWQNRCCRTDSRQTRQGGVKV